MKRHQKTINIFHFAVLSVAAASTAAWSQTAEPPKPPKDGGEDRTECRTVMLTGTRFDRRICKKASEWAAIAENSRNGFKEAQDRNWICVNPNSGRPC